MSIRPTNFQHCLNEITKLFPQNCVLTYIHGSPQHIAQLQLVSSTYNSSLHTSIKCIVTSKTHHNLHNVFHKHVQIISQDSFSPYKLLFRTNQVKTIISIWYLIKDVQITSQQTIPNNTQILLQSNCNF
jgi:hypothetical protein